MQIVPEVETSFPVSSFGRQSTLMEILPPEVSPVVVSGQAVDFRFRFPGETAVGTSFPVSVSHGQAILVGILHPS